MQMRPRRTDDNLQKLLVVMGRGSAKKTEREAPFVQSKNGVRLLSLVVGHCAGRSSSCRITCEITHNDCWRVDAGRYCPWSTEARGSA